MHFFQIVPNPKAAEDRLKAQGYFEAILIGSYNECVLLFLIVVILGDSLCEHCLYRALLALNYDARRLVCHDSVADASAFINPVIVLKLIHLEADLFIRIWLRDGCRELRQRV